MNLSFDLFDYMRAALSVGRDAGRPFAFASDCPYEYYMKYPGNPGGWSAAWQATNRAKIRLYENWLQTNGCRHTQICNSYDGGSTSNPDAWDLNYKNQSLAVFYLHQQEGGRARRYLFESWYQGPFTVAPETKSGSYANLALDAIKYLKGLRDTSGTPEALDFTLVSNGVFTAVQLRNNGDVACLPAVLAFESGDSNVTIRYYDTAWRDITAALRSAEGWVGTNLLQPAQSVTLLLHASTTGSLAAASNCAVSLEAFWNPQDPTGLVRDRLVVTPAVQAVAPVGLGFGLCGDYFNDTNFTKLKLTRTNATVNFDWGNGSPDTTIGSNSFSVRWTGKVQARDSGPCLFHTVTDDGVRLWVNNQLLIDHWANQSAVEWTATNYLSAGPY